jgi:hypothetical protein
MICGNLVHVRGNAQTGWVSLATLVCEARALSRIYPYKEQQRWKNREVS